VCVLDFGVFRCTFIAAAAGAKFSVNSDPNPESRILINLLTAHLNGGDVKGMSISGTNSSLFLRFKEFFFS
jgi:hypothetical protein